MNQVVLKRLMLTLVFVMLLLPMCKADVQAKVILTGNKKIDMAAEYIIQRVSKPNMTRRQKLKACYSFLVNKMTYTHGRGHVRIKLNKKQKKASAQALKEMKKKGVKYSSKFRGDYRNLLTLSGTCKDMSGVMCILANHLGYRAGYVSGRYVRSNGSSVEHWWNWISIKGKKYYCDVQAANDISKKHKYKWYLKTRSNSYWRRHHRG